MQPELLTPISDTRRVGSRDGLILAALTLLALLLRLYRLDFRGLWTDEFHTLLSLQMPLPDLIRNRLAAGHLPTYFILMKLWTNLAGTSDWALRLPSAVFGALLVPAAVFLARPFASRPFVFILAGVAALNGAVLWAGQEARMYALLAVAATFCHAFYLRTFLHPRSALNWIGYYATLLVGISLQPVMLLWYVAHLVFTFTERKRHPAQARVAFTVAAAVLVALVPAALMFGGAQGKFTALRFDPATPWMIWTRLTTIAFGADNGARILGYLFRAAMAVCAVLGVRAWRRNSIRPDVGEAEGIPDPSASRLLLKFSFATVAVPALVLWMGECFLPNVLGPWRYQLPSAVLLWSLLLWAVLEVGNRTAKRVLMGALGVLVLGGAVAQWADEGSGLREATRFLAARVKPADAVVLPESNTLALGLKRYGIPAGADLLMFPENAGTQELTQRFQAVQGRERLWLVMYRLRKHEREDLVKRFGQMSDRFTPIPDQSFRYEQAEVLAYRIRR